MTEPDLPDDYDIPADLSPELRALWILIATKVEDCLGPILEELAGAE